MSETLSFDEIEQMNIVGAAKMAPVWIADKDLFVPEADLNLFFQNAPGTRMLDVGCGWGRYVHLFIENGKDYIGIDHSPPMIAAARELNPYQEFRLASYRDFGTEFDPESFDALWCCCIFGGTPKAQVPEVLEQFRRILVPGGAIVIVLPHSFESFEGVHETRVGPMYFSEWEFEEFGPVLHAAGFDIIDALQRLEHGSMTFIGRKR